MFRLLVFFLASRKLNPIYYSLGPRDGNVGKLCCALENWGKCARLVLRAMVKEWTKWVTARRSIKANIFTIVNPLMFCGSMVRDLFLFKTCFKLNSCTIKYSFCTLRILIFMFPIFWEKNYFRFQPLWKSAKVHDCFWEDKKIGRVKTRRLWKWPSKGATTA